MYEETLLMLIFVILVEYEETHTILFPSTKILTNESAKTFEARFKM